MVVGGAAIVAGGIVTVAIASSAAVKLLQDTSESKQKKTALPCLICRGVGFYICKLCKSNSTIHWSPLYDPVAFNPCLCPTCDGHRVQRCLNCLGNGYSPCS